MRQLPEIVSTRNGGRHRLPRGRKQLRNSEQGAALVEFVMVLPLLLILLFGLIEMSWAFAQVNDVRHGAREGARSAAVAVGDVNAIGAEVCGRMDVVKPAQNVQVALANIAGNPTVPGEGSVGGLGQITVTADLDTITGFFDFLLGSKDVSSTVEFRLEQPSSGDGDAAWWADVAAGTTTYVCP